MFSQTKLVFRLLPLALFALVQGQSNIAAVELDVSAQVPGDASKPIEPGFVGLACETSSFPAYSGNKSSPNNFSRNLVKSIASRQGSAVNFRVGGTSGDYSKLLLNQAEAVKIPSDQIGNNVAYNITLGPSWFEGFKNFAGVQWVYQVPLAHLDQENSIEATNIALSTIGTDNLYALEIGNEPDLYPAKWSTDDYASEWLAFDKAIRRNVTLPAGRNIQAGTIAGVGVGDWTLPNLLATDIDSTKMVKAVSTHYYQWFGIDPSRFERDLMNHTALVATMTNTTSAARFLSQNYPNIPFVMGEVGTYPGAINDYAVEQSLAATLWNTNFIIYAMSQNVSRVNMQQGLGFGYSAWTPGPDPDNGNQGPGVWGPYYALPFAADFIGGVKSLKVVPVLQEEKLVVYGGYDLGQLSKLVIINLDVWNTTSSFSRPSRQVKLRVPSNVSKARAERLTGPGADAGNGITWAGASWSYQSMGLPVQTVNDTEIISAFQEHLLVEVQSSEAVMISVISNESSKPSTAK